MRWNSPYINHFTQPDSIIPDQTNPQGWDRYAYVMNNPVKLIDPTGHQCVGEEGECEQEDGTPINGAGGLVSGNNGGNEGNPSPINDPNWNKLNPVERAQIVWNAICQSGGWWGEGCPSEQELASWLLFEEGGNLTSEYQENMARGIRYRFAIFGNSPESFVFQLSGLTAFYNPNSGSGFDQNDWIELTNPHFNFESQKNIIDIIYKGPIGETDGNYMYWWREDEVKNPPGKWPGSLGVKYFQTTVDGVNFYFTGVPNIQRCAMGIDNTACK